MPRKGLTGYLDYVLLPALAFFIGLTINSLSQKKWYDTYYRESLCKESRP
ncbi:mercuric ion transport protein/mercuric ion transport protein [Marinobacter daqiaonensis]|uniref:Mercuric ion transport protein/mercuric ion transport protein n=1 Tax=Marinobacter daqiaonensis TaxID=650891 RepID=A0A1I6GPZ2_9GAMM|nr:mercuric ion transport protein/mercuric ion transport protein [Marinobacter daqiaonensis]